MATNCFGSVIVYERPWPLIASKRNMQAGFALVETGMTQAKNAAHVVSTNFAIFGLGFIGF